MKSAITVVDEVDDECPPTICTLKCCLFEALDGSGYSVGQECGKGGVVVSFGLFNIRLLKVKGGACGGERYIADLRITIEVKKCGQDDCAAAIAHRKIKKALIAAQIKCCSLPQLQSVDIDYGPKGDKEIWSTLYTLTFDEN